jgi:RsiW-degrading membrane proteinase PrsW (M82 family)
VRAEGDTIMSIASVLATLIPLAMVIGSAIFAKSLKRLSWLLVLNVLWGMLATYLVLEPNNWVVSLIGYSAAVSLLIPLIEEMAKSFPLIWLTSTKRCQWYVDGAILGTACGAGFAIRETWFDLGGQSGDFVGLLIARTTSTNLLHMGTCTIIGAALALAARRPWKSRLVISIGGFLIAGAVHGTFNQLQSHVEGSVGTTIIGVSIIVVTRGIVALGFPISRYWVRQDLERDGATPHEEHVLAGGHGTAKVLDDFSQLFGREAAETLFELINAQRALGIARHGGHDPNRILLLQGEVNRLKDDLGPSGLLWLRATTDTDPPSPFWSHMLHLHQTAEPSAS